MLHQEWERTPEHDKRIARGDDYAGDAWRHAPTGRLKVVAVGRGPIEQEPDGGENGEAFKDMAAHIWAAGVSLEDADFITRMLAKKGLYLFETKPWQRCPSTHCERGGLCCSPRDCTIKTPTLP